MMERVIVLFGASQAGLGLVSVARSLTGAEGSLAGLSVSTAGPLEGLAGATHVYRPVAPDFDPTRGDHLSAAVVAAVRAFDATIVLSGPTKLEREAMARAGARLGAPSITGVRELRRVGDGLDFSRDLLSGNATSVEHASSRPVLISLSEVPTVGLPAPPPKNPPPTLAPLLVDLPSYPFRRISFHPKPASEVNLESADRVVSVGRGLQRKEDLALIESLATVLGADIGCTRPIAAESGWLGEEHWVGLTGHRVHPRLYVAIGISGAAQHLVGMRDSKIVVAINRDENAPILLQADYQVVGDLYAIVPELTRRWAASSTGSN